MADLTDAELILIRRTGVGSGVLDEEIQEAYDREGNGTLKSAAVEILEIRYADYIANPLAFTIVSEYSQDATKNVNPMLALLNRVKGMEDDLSDLAAGTAGGTVLVPNGRAYPR
jgi:hypothetical protein